MRFNKSVGRPFTSLVFTLLTVTSTLSSAAPSLETARFLPFLRIENELEELQFRYQELNAEKNLNPQSSAAKSSASSEMEKRMKSLSDSLKVNLVQHNTLLHELRSTTPSPLNTIADDFKDQVARFPWKDKWKLRETLVITDYQNFTLNPQPRVFSMPLHTANYELNLENRLPFTQPDPIPGQPRLQEPPIDVRLQCTRPVQMEQSLRLGVEEGTSLKFKMWNSRVNGQKITLRFPDPSTRCTLAFRSYDSQQAFAHGVHLHPEHELYPEVKTLQSSVELCTLTQTPQKGVAADLFFGSNHKILGCPHPTGRVEFLSDAYQAFNERIKALTGSDIPRSVFDSQNLNYPVDYSQAPKLDLIVVSTLQFKSDFVGTMLSRALKFHADRGAMIRIMSTGILLADKDKRMIDNLVAEGRGHIKYQPFSYKQIGPVSDGLVDRVHRTNHLKLFLGYSSTQPEKSFVMVGGRNIRDSYYFWDAPDYSANPSLIQYSAKEEMFIHYVDLEVLLRSAPMVRQTAMQFLSFFNRDADTMRSEKTSYLLPTQPTAQMRDLFATARESTGWARHFISVPYTDGGDMEALFVNMIDSAKKKIRLISPYFAPRKALLEALSRAADRGVQVQVITRLNLAGDDIPKITEDINKRAINRTFQKLEVFEWVEAHSILHTKALSIDEDLLYIGGTNINNRSFVHDLEGGFVFTGKEVLADFDKLYDGHFMKKSERVTGARKVGFVNSILIWFAQSYF